MDTPHTPHTPTETTYNALWAQLNQVLSRLESDSLPLEELSRDLDTAFALLEALHTRLRDVEMKVNGVMAAHRGTPNEEPAHGAAPDSQ